MVGHLPDLESDFSAIHHILINPDRGDYGGLSGPQFFRLAWRVAHYPGAIRARVLRDQDDSTPKPLAMNDPLFADLIEYGG